MSESVIKKSKELFYALLILVMFFTGCKGSQETKTEKVAQQTLEQLKNDYNEEFEIESADYIKETDSYTLFVHPKSEPDMSFRVIKWKKAGNELIDNYIPNRRDAQTNKIFKPFADSVNTKNLLFVAVGDPMKAGENITDDKIYYDMKYSIEDLIKIKKDKIRVVMMMFFFFDLHEWNREEVCKKIYEMIKYIQDTGVAEADISIQFYDEKFFKDKDVEKILKEDMGPAGMMNFQSTYSAKYKTVNIIFEEKKIEE